MQPVWQEGDKICIHGEATAREMPEKGEWEAAYLDGESEI